MHEEHTKAVIAEFFPPRRTKGELLRELEEARKERDRFYEKVKDLEEKVKGLEERIKEMKEYIKRVSVATW